MASNNVQQNAVLATLAYHDIFHFPLSLKEIDTYCIAKKSLSLVQLRQQLKNKFIQEKQGLYFLKGREYLVERRLEREAISNAKLKKARQAGKLLSLLPTIQYIGVSGSLAMKNATKEDDIDLFIITTSGSLWWTRLLVTVVLLTIGSLRTYKKKQVSNTICTNMWIDNSHLSFPSQRQNMYTAHEIVQMYTLFSRRNMYQQFLYANQWIQSFLPHTNIQQVHIDTSQPSLLLRAGEFLAKQTQLWYMSRHRTSETITSGFIAFHPKDYTMSVLSKWQKRMKIYGI